ncbi:MAG: prepilin peptidase [Lachnospiraceae bacterium]|nr:prepilin peptidase [Lachnospiraceae bacterium]
MQNYLLTGILAMAAVWDLSYARIPNALILAGYAAAFSNVYPQDRSAVADCFLGLLLPYLTLMVFFAVGNLGAGDIKLCSVVGAFLGVRAVLHVIGGAIVVGAIISGLKILIETGRQRRYPQGMTIRFALPILCGTMFHLLFGV